MSLREEPKLASLQSRLNFLYLIVIGFVSILIGRLYYLQIKMGEKYSKLATEIVVREEQVYAKRGNITDRNGKVLASSRSYFEVTITPQYLKKKKFVIKTLAGILNLTEKEINKKLKKAIYQPRFMPVVIAEDLDYDQVAKLNELLSPIYDDKSAVQLEAVSLRAYPIREYLYPEPFSHALGYLTEVSKEKLKKYEKLYPGVYSRGDLTGASGLERAYDVELKGQDGQIARIVDARGREMDAFDDLLVIKQKATISPVSGYVLKTTLDFDAQLAAQKALGERKGAVVAIDPNTGEVLTLISTPGFDANRILKNVDKKYWQHINLHEDKILFNRAVQAMYPPASTYKPLALVAAIEEKAIDPETTKFSCHGGLHYAGRYFKCWRRGGHGTLSAVHGLSQSCDVYFYQIGKRLGVDGLAKYAKIFGYGEKTGIEIPYEKSGLVPTKAWKKRRYNQEWFDSETLSVSIGQSYNLVTPLQMAKMVSLIANDGYYITPHLGKEILDRNGKVFKKISYPKKPSSLKGAKSLEWARKGMIEVVHGYGTAKRLRKSPYKIAGKTGTAQVIGHDSGRRKTKNTQDHGLFIAFAPYDNPKIAVAVIVENGRSGSGAAAPVAMEVIDAYLSKVMPSKAENENR